LEPVSPGARSLARSLVDTGGPSERRTRSDDIAVPRSSRCGSLRPWASWPYDWGKGSLTLHSGRPLLRMGVRWRGLWGQRHPHCVRGIYLKAGENRAFPPASGAAIILAQNPFPFLYEGVSWTKGSHYVEEVIECQGVSHFTLQEWCPPAGGFLSAASPTS